MNASGFIASKLKFSGTVAMVCIAISFLIMIVSVSIASGFRREISDGISFVSGDIQLLPQNMNYAGDSDPIDAKPSFYGKIDSIKGVKSINPVIYRAGILKSGEAISGVLFKGLPDNPDLLKKAHLDAYGKDSLTLQASVPRKLADQLGLKEGGNLQVYFIGSKVKVRKFTVKSICDDLISVGDYQMVYTNLADLQRLNGWTEDKASALEINLDESYRSNSKTAEISSDIGSIALLFSGDDDPSLVSVPTFKRYPQIFDWLKLIDFNVLFILVLMTIVAAFNMISGLLILLFRNISTIGTLKTLGMTDSNIVRVFLKVSSVLVLKGMAVGNVIALLFCIIQSATHLIGLNPENYSVSFVPVRINWGLILGADALSFLVIMLILLIPSLFISRVDPADTVRVS